MNADSGSAKPTIYEGRGYFWWHGSPAKPGCLPGPTVMGTLRISEDGLAHLDLDGVLPDADGSEIAMPRDDAPLTRLIEGRLREKQNRVLLMGLRVSTWFWTSGVGSYRHYTATSCLVGVDSSSALPSDLRFRQLQCDLMGYDDWIGLKPIQLDRQKESLRVDARAPRRRSYRLKEGTLAVEHALSSPGLGTSYHRALTLEAVSRITIQRREACPIEDLLPIFAALVEWMMLLTDSAYGLDWPSVGGTRKTAPFRYYFWRTRPSAPPPRWHDVWVSYANVAGSFGKLFEAWCENRTEGGPAYTMYFTSRRGVTQFVENRFLNLIMGLESFHRWRGSPSPNEAALQAKIVRIIGQVQQKKDRDWLQGRLRHATEPSLEGRLFALFEPLFQLNPERVRAFAKSCADIRNRIAHFGGAPLGKPRELMRRLDILGNALSTLYAGVLLQDLGFSHAHLNDVVYKGPGGARHRQALIDAELLESAVTRSAAPSSMRPSTPSRSD